MQAQATELTIEKVNQAVNAIVDTLGTPESEFHTKAIAAFHMHLQVLIVAYISTTPKIRCIL